MNQIVSEQNQSKNQTELYRMLKNDPQNPELEELYLASWSTDTRERVISIVDQLNIPLTRKLYNFIDVCNFDFNQLEENQQRELFNLLDYFDEMYVEMALFNEFSSRDLSSKNFSIERIKELATDFEQKDFNRRLEENNRLQEAKRSKDLENLQNYISTLPQQVQEAFSDINLEEQCNKYPDFYFLLKKFHELITEIIGIDLRVLDKEYQKNVENPSPYCLLGNAKKLYRESFFSIIPLLAELDLGKIDSEQLEILYYILKDNNLYQISHVEELKNYRQHRKDFYQKEIYKAQVERDSKKLFDLFKQYFFGPLYYSKKAITDCDKIYEYKDIQRLDLTDKEKKLISELQRLRYFLGFDFEKTSVFVNQSLQDFPDGYFIDDLYEKIRSLVEKEYRDYLQKPFDVTDPSVSVTNQKYNGTDIPIYQCAGNPFHLLIHVIKDSPNQNKEVKIKPEKIINDPLEWTIGTGIDYISTSLITDDYIYGCAPAVGRGDFLIYGFNNFETGSLLATYPGDAGTSHDTKYKRKDVVKLNTFDNPQTLTETLDGADFSFYNEVVLQRKTQKPDFIMCYDGCNETALKHAAFWQVPVIVIETRKYEEKYQEEYEKAVTEFIANPTRENYSKLYRYNSILSNRVSRNNPTLIDYDIFRKCLTKPENSDFFNKMRRFILENFQNWSYLSEIFKKTKDIDEIHKFQQQLYEKIMNEELTATYIQGQDEKIEEHKII